MDAAEVERLAMRLSEDCRDAGRPTEGRMLLWAILHLLDGSGTDEDRRNPGEALKRVGDHLAALSETAGKDRAGTPGRRSP